MEYVRPVIKKTCPHCYKKEVYYIEDTSEYGEVKCKACGKEYWSNSLIDFYFKIKGEN